MDRKRDFLSLGLNSWNMDEANDVYKYTGLGRRSRMEWSFSNKSSAATQLLSFNGTQEERPRKTMHDMLGSSAYTNVPTVDAFDTSRMYSGVRVGNRYPMPMLPQHHFHPYANFQPQETRVFPFSRQSYANNSVAAGSPFSQPRLASNGLDFGSSTRLNFGSSTINPQPSGGLPSLSRASDSSAVKSAADTTNLSAPKTDQLTIFYAGAVHVYDDIPPEKAQAIMLLAGDGSSRNQNKTLPAAQVQDSAPSYSLPDEMKGENPHSASTFPSLPRPMPVTASAGQLSGGVGSKNEFMTLNAVGAVPSSSNQPELNKVTTISSMFQEFAGAGSKKDVTAISLSSPAAQRFAGAGSTKDITAISLSPPAGAGRTKDIATISLPSAAGQQFSGARNKKDVKTISLSSAASTKDVTTISLSSPAGKQFAEAGSTKDVTPISLSLPACLQFAGAENTKDATTISFSSATGKQFGEAGSSKDATTISLSPAAGQQFAGAGSSKDAIAISLSSAASQQIAGGGSSKDATTMSLSSAAGRQFAGAGSSMDATSISLLPTAGQQFSGAGSSKDVATISLPPPSRTPFAGAGSSKDVGTSKNLATVASESFKVNSAVGPASALVSPGGLPLARKASLARFLERRKDRVISTSPYSFCKKSPERGNSGS